MRFDFNSPIWGLHHLAKKYGYSVAAITGASPFWLLDPERANAIYKDPASISFCDSELYFSHLANKSNMIVKKEELKRYRDLCEIEGEDKLQKYPYHYH